MAAAAVAVVAVAVVAVASITCGRSDATLPSPGPLVAGQSQPAPTPRPAPTPTPTPVPVNVEDVLRDAGVVLEGLSSFHFRFRHEDGGTEFATGIIVEDAEGDVVNPDRIAVAFTGTFGQGFAIRSRLITTGQTSYMTNPLSGKWEEIPVGVSPLGFFSPAKGIAAMMSELRDPILASNSDAKTHIVVGKLPATAMKPLLGSALPGAIVDVELTIDADTLYVTKAKSTGRATASDAPDLVRVVSLSGFNEPTSIEAPRDE